MAGKESTSTDNNYRATQTQAPKSTVNIGTSSKDPEVGTTNVVYKTSARPNSGTVKPAQSNITEGTIKAHSSPVPSLTNNAIIKVENITHESVTVFWELLLQPQKNRDEDAYRLVGYELMPHGLHVHSKITDLFVNTSGAAGQGMHRLTQKRLNHHTPYVFCVIPAFMDSNGTSLTVTETVADMVRSNSTDCVAFTTPYNPLNPEALTAMILAVFIVIAFLVVLVLGKLCEKPQEKEKVRV